MKAAVFVTMQNHWNYSALACRKFEENTPDEIELHLIDDCSTEPESLRWLEQMKASCRWRIWRHDQPAGLIFGWNEALQYCIKHSLDYVGIANNDIVVGHNWFTALKRCLDLDSKIGLVGPLSNNSGHQPRQYILRRSSPTLALDKYTPDEVSDYHVVGEICSELETWCAETNRYVDELPYANGFMFLLRGNTVRETGLCNPKNRNLGGEDDYQRRMRKQGWKSCCSLETFVWHAKDVTMRRGKKAPGGIKPRLNKNSLELSRSGMHSFTSILERWLLKIKPERIIEWGPGLSTDIMLKHCPDAKILSIEHNRKWFNIAKSKASPNFQLVFKEVACLNSTYATCAYNFLQCDFAFVDGRRRVECCLVALTMLSERGVVMLHDWNRINYQRVLKHYATIVEEADDTVVLRPKIKLN